MNYKIEEKIYGIIPELNPLDPRSVHYVRELNYNHNILKECMGVGLLLIFYILFVYFNRIQLNFLRWTLNVFILFCFLLNKISILLVKVYQNLASDKVRNRCRYEPSCSNYTIEALKKYSFIKAFYISTKRLYKCSFTSGGGFEKLK